MRLIIGKDFVAMKVLEPGNERRLGPNPGVDTPLCARQGQAPSADSGAPALISNVEDFKAGAAPFLLVCCSGWQSGRQSGLFQPTFGFKSIKAMLIII